MTAAKAAWTAFAIGAVLILAFYFTQPTTTDAQRAGEHTAPTTTQEPADAGQSSGSDTTGEAVDAGEPMGAAGAGVAGGDSPAGIDRGNGFAQGFPDADQAPVQPELAQYERHTITFPPAPTPDTQDPAAVAEAFLTVYNSRSSESDDTWQEDTQAWLVPDLAAQLQVVTNGALEGKTPAAVRAVQVGENVTEWGIDTPLRWAHHVQVIVDTQDQGSYALDYRVRSQLTEQGWLINAAPLDGWQRVTD